MERGRWIGLQNEETWEGIGNEGNIVVGDRVCVVRGQDNVKGKIGVVTDVDLEKAELKINGVNEVSRMPGE
jgi:ribosomal protein L24